MKEVRVDKILDFEDVRNINKEASNGNIIVVLKNTRNIKKELLTSVSKNVTFSITGGLDPSKKKFNNNHYQKRTRYSKEELFSIISEYEKIERKINPTWSKLEKVMFVYKSLFESMVYEENTYNNRDASRNLLGMITKKSVCSGFAMLFKEAMDRIGVECIYQNAQGHHSWNIVKIDGVYHPVELTWEIYNKVDNNCPFHYFCRQNSEKFYSHVHHNISYESEERKYPMEAISDEKLSNALGRIKNPMFTQIKNASKTQDTISVYGYTIKISLGYPVVINSLGLRQSNNTFFRDDDTSFTLVKSQNASNGLIEYAYIEYNPEKDILTVAKIFSEMDLLSPGLLIRKNIANNLLTKERVRKKVNEFNGYVGYVTKGSMDRFYNPDIETNIIGKHR